ncbi:MerR family transcriptional regulator [uncultured Roseibium sp.]|uniref:MerR family transcriptional regulator n=1 Tax=uncultured Roseibium sp. TaxID=1936171 RepID=UPI002610F802|nr:MerR family transcriptional regulator [uncultured Roseibium sp.]
MDKTSPQDVLLTAAECAARTGISVRTLRVYEANGLLSPVRSQKNWRLYSSGDIARLNEILSLKQLGLSLSAIAEILEGRMTDVGRLLDIQKTILTARQEQAERGLRLVAQLQSKNLAGEGLSMGDLLDLAKETKMNEAADEYAWKRYDQARPRTEIEPDRENLQACAGEYRFEDGIAIRITSTGKALRGELLGQPEFDLFAEAPDRFFLKVTPAQFTFSRDAEGAVEGLVLHQGGFEMKAERCAEGVFATAKAKLEDRIRNKTPFAGGEQKLRRLIGEHREGKPDYVEMTPVLKSLVEEQLPVVVKELERLGQMRSVEFRGVGVDGFDIYIVEFENGRMEWGLSQCPDETLNGLFMRPVP